MATVSQVSRRFVREGREQVLAEKPRPGQAPKLTGEAEAQLCLLADKRIELGLVESITDWSNRSPKPRCARVRQDYEYTGHGKVNRFVAGEPLSGGRSVRVTERHTSVDFAEELRHLVDIAYPEAEQVVGSASREPM